MILKFSFMWKYRLFYDIIKKYIFVMKFYEEVSCCIWWEMFIDPWGYAYDNILVSLGEFVNNLKIKLRSWRNWIKLEYLWTLKAVFWEVMWLRIEKIEYCVWQGVARKVLAPPKNFEPCSHCGSNFFCGGAQTLLPTPLRV